MKKALLIVILIFIINSITTAQTVIAKYGGEFMSFGVGGRALGLGGAYSALAQDASAGYYNPAAISRIQYPEIMAMHDARFGDLINYDVVTVALPYGYDASVGFSVMRLGVDGIPDTRKAWIDKDGNQVFDFLYDQLDYDKITYFNAADWALYLTYAKKESEYFSYGANVKIIKRDIAEFSAIGIGFDAGVLYSPIKDLYLAVNAQDITTTLIAWSTGRNELVTPTLKVGGAYSIEMLGGKLSPVVDLDIRFENRKYASIANVGPVSLDPHAGLEFDYKNIFALRAGYTDIKQFTLGAGIHLRKLDIDYSFARFGSRENDLGNTHRISLRFILQEDKFARTTEKTD
jgi:hypothetical protein